MLAKHSGFVFHKPTDASIILYYKIQQFEYFILAFVFSIGWLQYERSPDSTYNWLTALNNIFLIFQCYLFEGYCAERQERWRIFWSTGDYLLASCKYKDSGGGAIQWLGLSRSASLRIPSKSSRRQDEMAKLMAILRHGYSFMFSQITNVIKREIFNSRTEIEIKKISKFFKRHRPELYKLIFIF